MIRKVPSPKPGCVRVFFELPACIWTDHIFLVGDFNDWNTTSTPFAQDRDAVWRIVLDLPAYREYEFRYLWDGIWQTDFHADGWTTNDFGGQNSIVDATLPPEIFPAVDDTSLLHDRLKRQGTQTQHFLIA